MTNAFANHDINHWCLISWAFGASGLDNDGITTLSVYNSNTGLISLTTTVDFVISLPISSTLSLGENYSIEL